MCFIAPANYILLALSVDRVLAVWKPLTYRIKSKPVIAKWATMLIGILMSIICAPTFVAIGLEGDDCFPGKHATEMIPAELEILKNLEVRKSSQKLG